MFKNAERTFYRRLNCFRVPIVLRSSFSSSSLGKFLAVNAVLESHWKMAQSSLKVRLKVSRNHVDCTHTFLTRYYVRRVIRFRLFQSSHFVVFCVLVFLSLSVVSSIRVGLYYSGRRHAPCAVLVRPLWSSCPPLLFLGLHLGMLLLLLLLMMMMMMTRSKTRRLAVRIALTRYVKTEQGPTNLEASHSEKSNISGSRHFFYITIHIRPSLNSRQRQRK